MTDIKIDKDVLLFSRHRRCKYPWNEMEIGESFFVPNVKISRMSSQASTAGINLSCKFTCRTVNGGVRIWRVK